MTFAWSGSRPARVGLSQWTAAPMLAIPAPTAAGNFRAYVYALDGKGHAGTANIPFQVK
ncbi:MAG TPA: hypothetical protein VH374_11015 [Polyangia bacterium]|jgi:hypothetical protein|nr:hypothetical protein [Polyangia bacterium]